MSLARPAGLLRFVYLLFSAAVSLLLPRLYCFSGISSSDLPGHETALPARHPSLCPLATNPVFLRTPVSRATGNLWSYVTPVEPFFLSERTHQVSLYFLIQVQVVSKDVFVRLLCRQNWERQRWLRNKEKRHTDTAEGDLEEPEFCLSCSYVCIYLTATLLYDLNVIYIANSLRALTEATKPHGALRPMCKCVCNFCNQSYMQMLVCACWTVPVFYFDWRCVRCKLHVNELNRPQQASCKISVNC